MKGIEVIGSKLSKERGKQINKRSVVIIINYAVSPSKMKTNH